MAGFCEARLRNFFSASGTVDPPLDAFRFKTAPTNALAIVAAFGRVWQDSAKHGSGIFFPRVELSIHHGTPCDSKPLRQTRLPSWPHLAGYGRILRNTAPEFFFAS